MPTARETGNDFRQMVPIKPASNSRQPRKKHSPLVEQCGCLETGCDPGSLPECSPTSFFSEHPSPPQSCGGHPNSPSKSCSGNRGREEVGLASDRGRKAASHAHCAGRHQEIKPPRHCLQQRSTRNEEGGGGAGGSAYVRKMGGGGGVGGAGTTKGQG